MSNNNQYQSIPVLHSVFNKKEIDQTFVIIEVTIRK